MSIDDYEIPQQPLHPRKYAEARKVKYKQVYLHRPHYEKLLLIKRGDESISSTIGFLVDYYNKTEEHKLEKGDKNDT